MTLEEIFRQRPQARAIHEAVCAAVAKIGPSKTRTSKSQVGFYRGRSFAATWIPEKYLKNDRLAPLVLSIYLPRCDRSNRWKEVVEPSRGRFTHHVELRHVSDVDDFIERRLAEAWAEAE
jgi:hypothetical protein